jgi:hypothetical protein
MCLEIIEKQLAVVYGRQSLTHHYAIPRLASKDTIYQTFVAQHEAVNLLSEASEAYSTDSVFLDALQVKIARSIRRIEKEMLGQYKPSAESYVALITIYTV